MKVAIIGAMEEEVTLLRDKIENKTVEVIAGCEFTTGIWMGLMWCSCDQVSEK